jgi:hypothetical protein
MSIFHICKVHCITTVILLFLLYYSVSIFSLQTRVYFRFIRFIIALHLFYYSWSIIKFNINFVNKSVFQILEVHHTTAVISEQELQIRKQISLMETDFLFKFTHLQCF